MSDDWDGDEGDDHSSYQEDSEYFDDDDYSRSRSSHSSGSRSPSRDDDEFSGSYSSRGSQSYSDRSGSREGSDYSDGEDGSGSYSSRSRSQSEQDGFGDSFYDEEHDVGDDGGSYSGSQSDPDDYDGSGRMKDGSEMFDRVSDTLDWAEGQGNVDLWGNQNAEPKSPSRSSRRDRRGTSGGRSNHSRSRHRGSPGSHSRHSNSRHQVSPQSRSSHSKRRGERSNLASTLPAMTAGSQMRSPPARSRSNVSEHSEDIMFNPPSPSAFQPTSFSERGNAMNAAAKNSIDNLFPENSPKPPNGDVESQSNHTGSKDHNNMTPGPTFDFQQSLSDGLELRKPDSNESKLRSSDPNIDFGGVDDKDVKDTFEDEDNNDDDNNEGMGAGKGPKRESATQYERRKARKRYQRRAAMSCVLIAGIVVLVVLLAAKGTETYIDYYYSEVPTLSPTISPSPTFLNETALNGTDSNSTEEMAPTLPPNADNIFDRGSTLLPTVVNDECVGAVTLSFSGSDDSTNIEDSNTNTTDNIANTTEVIANATTTTRRIATESSSIIVQGSTVDANGDWSNGLDACGTVHLNGHGVWYTVRVNEETPLVASTCTESTWYDTQLSVYRHKNNESNELPSCLTADNESHQLECVAGNDQSGTRCGNTGDQSRLAWFAEAGEDYWILVHGFQGSAGTFELVVDKLAVDNDYWEDSIVLTVASVLDTGTDPIFGSTIGSTVDTEVLTLCDGSSAKGPGVWYKINPEHVGAVRAVIFTEETGFDGELLVLKRPTTAASGDGNTGSFECAESGQGNEVITWVALPRNEYFLLIRGRTAESEGDFGLRVYQRPLAGSRPPSNDRCPQASSIPVNSIGTIESIEGDTTIATRDDSVLATCGHLVWFTAPGVWYLIEPDLPDNGQSLSFTATVCTALPLSSNDGNANNPNLPSGKVSVFEGNSCDQLQCVDGHAPIPVLAHGISATSISVCASVSWFTEPGQQYRVLVHGYGSHEGLFNLSLTSTVVTDSTASDCTNAEEILLAEDAGRSILGSLDTSADFNQSDLSLCDLYSGISSNTSNPDGSSDGGVDVGAAWYRVVGTGQRLIASTCHQSTAFGAQVDVLLDDSSVNNTGCENLVCIDTIVTSGCPYGEHMTVAWNSILGRVYYVLVRKYGGNNTVTATEGEVNATQGGAGGEGRNFVLTVDEASLNDSPEAAVGLMSLSPPLQPEGIDPLGERATTLGSTRTAGAEYDIQALCPSADIDDGESVVSPSRGLWYTIKGNGESLTASICNQLTGFDGLVSIFVEPGENSTAASGLECVGGTYSSSSEATVTCPRTSTITWTAQVDIIYFVLVQGVTGDDFGNFGLRVTKA